jgi:hypothetical protein
MSADRTLVFYGLRYAFSSEDLDILDDGTRDPRVAAAVRADLDVYYANFGGPEEQHFLFIGKNLGSLGLEDARQIVFSPTELQTTAVQIDQKLASAELEGVPALYCQWQQDM